MKATRLIFIKRSSEQEVVSKDGTVKTEKIIKRYPCRINNEIPPSHFLSKNE